MTRKISMTEDRFRALLKLAYTDGWEDGQNNALSIGQVARELTDTDWEDSVTFDLVNLALTNNRNGKVI